MQRDDIELAVLGSLRARAGDIDLELGPPQRRMVLAVLLCGVREVIATGRLLDCVWGERAGQSALGSLHAHVSHLRKSLGHGSIVRHPHGYALSIRPDQLDADVFSRLVRQGRASIEQGQVRRGRQQLSEALALWRGRAYEEFEEAPWARREIVRLEAGRLGALATRIDADLDVGDADVVGELEALAIEHPLHEGFCARLMLALYRAGRQADALTVYRLHADRLVESSGLEPTPTLRNLQLRILHHDPSLAMPGRQADDKPATSDDVQDPANQREEEP